LPKAKPYVTDGGGRWLLESPTTRAFMYRHMPLSAVHRARVMDAIIRDMDIHEYAECLGLQMRPPPPRPAPPLPPDFGIAEIVTRATFCKRLLDARMPALLFVVGGGLMVVLSLISA
jgi:hypothetical protein